MEKERVCVTGAGGFVASWIVKLLLSKDYTVHGTVRRLDGKYDHLNKFENASENLKLFEADLLDYNSLCSAIKGCTGVLHVASPVPSSSVQNPEIELLEPAVKGTLNVLKACSEAKVKRVVYVSSISAIVMNPMWPKERVKDETCWSDKEYCITTKGDIVLPYCHASLRYKSEAHAFIAALTAIPLMPQNWYGLSKREAESAAVEFAKVNGLDMVRICPALVFGPLLQSRVNASSLVLVKLMEGTYLRLVNDGDDSMPNKLRNLVDVRDVAAAVLLGYENLEAEGRYVCTAHAIKTRDLVVKLRSSYPNYSYPQNETDEEDRLSSAKLQRLGWSYRPLEETLVDSIESYQKAGLLNGK
ncbi:cinnamoyl-CoA reductase 1-like isoform X2 [Syzygium oleosum]|uniref:cinnamoyl-CoA reductase 1-like isoform X2 n=1 Tax=Syzygium oleosum TaxID=219896 RepID=UPI0024B8C974|nr:cinnamoyl-CoA reductase 1-like isoform X2 [Syzygium oleosum]